MVAKSRDLVKGEVFGMLTVIEQSEQRLHNNITYRCLCECGKEKLAAKSWLKAGTVRSCGCLNSLASSVRKVEVTDSSVFGEWTVVSEIVQPKLKPRMFLVKCSCGNTGRVTLSALRTGHSTSCGHNNAVKTSERFKTHGKTGTKVYKTWASMCSRVLSDSVGVKEHYKDRGIVVCDRWRESFENFYEDMGDPPTKDHTIDRIDNDGNYCKENCRWASWSVQARNKERGGVKKGVKQAVSGRYYVKIGDLGGRAVHIGAYDTFEEAVKVRIAAEKLIENNESVWAAKLAGKFKNLPD